MKFCDAKLIAFDLDGTLVDSVPDLAAATIATLQELGLAKCGEHQVRHWVGNGARMLMTRAMSWALTQEVSESQLDAAMKKFMHHYQQHLQCHSQLYPDVKAVLAKLAEHDYSMVIVTNKPHRFAVPLIKSFGLDDYFSEILGGDSLAEMKPSPLPLVHLAEKFNLNAEQIVMVGDSRNDILAAQAAGCLSIGLTYGYNYGEDIGLCGPSAICDNFSEILAILDSRQAVMEHDNDD